MARGRLQACTSKTPTQVSLPKRDTLRLTSQEAQQRQWRVLVEVAAEKAPDFRLISKLGSKYADQRCHARP